MKLEIVPQKDNFKISTQYLIGSLPLTSNFPLPNSCLITFKKWAQDLRENKELQGYNRIANFDQNKFCALGILARCNLEEQAFYLSYRIRESYLHTAHMSRIFQYDFDPIIARIFQTIFAKLNDNIKLKFDEIAEILDKIVDSVTTESCIRFEFEEMEQ